MNTEKNHTMAIKQHTIDTPYVIGPVHCYTVERDGEIMLFDAGPPTDTAKQYILENIDLSRLKYVFITHCHIDHYGLAWWLTKNSDARLFIPYRDGLKILGHEERLLSMHDLLKSLGFGGDYLGGLKHFFKDGSIFPPFPKSFRVVEDDMPKQLGINFISCPGHSQSDLVYFSEDWAVTGDVLLKGVFQSPLLDIDLETGERFRNYDAYCSTLHKLASLRGKKICPGHRKGVSSVDDIICFYVRKMLERVSHIRGYNGRFSVAEIIEKIFGDALREPFHIYLKASEIVFMQDFLKKPEMLRESLEKIGLFDSVASAYKTAL